MFDQALKLIEDSKRESKYYQFVAKVKLKMLSSAKFWCVELKNWKAPQVIQFMIEYEENCIKKPNNSTLRNHLNAVLLVLREYENEFLQSESHIIKTVMNSWTKKRAIQGVVNPKKQANLVSFQQVKTTMILMMNCKKISPYRQFLHSLRMLLLTFSFSHGGRVGDYLSLRLDEITHFTDDLILWRQRRSKSDPKGEANLKTTLVANSQAKTIVATDIPMAIRNSAT